MKKQRKSGGGRPCPGFSVTGTGDRTEDIEIKRLIRTAIMNEGYAYGYHKLTHWLRRKHGLLINKKKVYRLCKEMCILQNKWPRREKHPRRISCNREVTGINQVWETDIKYGYIYKEQRFFFVQAVIDVFDRVVIDYHIGLTCTGEDAGLSVLGAYDKRREEMNEDTLVIRTDNGPQFISKAFETRCMDLGLEHEFIPVRTPNKNAHIESWHSILERECMRRFEFSSFTEAYLIVVDSLIITTKIGYMGL